MKKLLATSAAIALTSAAAQAGGLDRSGQPIGIIFEDGNYLEFSFGHVNPSVSGTAIPAFGGAPSGEVADKYNQIGMGLKMDVSDRASVALVLDQPFGASVSYNAVGYPVAGSYANASSMGLTALGRYKINDNFSVHGGVRHIKADAEVNTISSLGIYNGSFDGGAGTGFVIGGAYERPDIAMRVALTYSSEVDLDFDTVETLNGGLVGLGVTTVTMPESVNLDFQTGIAQDTLLFGSVRWADWTSTALAPAAYQAATTTALLDFDNATYTYNLGVGRRINENLSAAVSLTYEDSNGGLASNLAPTDGRFGITLGGSYTIDNMKLTAGINYSKLGDATTEVLNSSFTDNSVVGIGFKVGWSF